MGAHSAPISNPDFLSSHQILRENTDLIIQSNTGSGRITISEHFVEGNAIDHIEFANGDVMTKEDIDSRFTQLSDGDD